MRLGGITPVWHGVIAESGASATTPEVGGLPETKSFRLSGLAYKEKALTERQRLPYLNALRATVKAHRESRSDL